MQVAGSLEPGAGGSGTRAGRAPADELPPPLPELRDALAAVGLTARWDHLTPAHVAEIAALEAIHGIPRLVKAAQKAHRADQPAAFAQAWIGAWQAIPTLVGGVKPEKCDAHRLPQPCRSCAADRLVAGAAR